MFFKVVLIVVVLTVAVNASPANKVKRQIPTPPMPPGVPAPPMPPGMLTSFALTDFHRAKRQAPETTPPAPPSRFVRQAPESPPPPPSRIARSVFGEEAPKTIAQEAYFSKITTINGEK